MLRQLSTRSPLFLRVFLTTVSALAAVLFASAFSYARPAVVQLAYPALGTAASSSVSAYSASQSLHVRHLLHMNHLAHMAAVQQRVKAAAAAAYEAAHRPVVHAVAKSPVTADVVRPSAPAARSAAPSTARYTGSGSMQACIISRESGGNPNVFNASGHYGLYQFSYSTWVGSGGNGADFGHASVAEQNQVFANAVAARGNSDWAPYDGC